MRLLIGQLAITLLILGCLGLIYLNYQDGTYKYALPICIWMLIFVVLGIWTRTNPKKAFLVALIVYLVTVIVKDIILGEEYILPILFHIYFATSMIIGRNSSIEAFKKLTGD
jgi:hypothetical protein